MTPLAYLAISFIVLFGSSYIAISLIGTDVMTRLEESFGDVAGKLF